MPMTTLVRHGLAGPTIPEGMVRISAGAEHRYIWPVHLGGWQSLGWQLQPAADLSAPEPRVPEPLLPEPRLAELELEPDPDPDPETEADQASDVHEPQSEVVEAPPSGATDAAMPLPEATDFQALTKAQIIEHCSTIHGVELDEAVDGVANAVQATSSWAWRRAWGRCRRARPAPTPRCTSRCRRAGHR